MRHLQHQLPKLNLAEVPHETAHESQDSVQALPKVFRDQPGTGSALEGQAYEAEDLPLHIEQLQQDVRVQAPHGATSECDALTDAARVPHMRQGDDD